MRELSNQTERISPAANASADGISQPSYAADASTADGITGAVRRDEEGVEWIDHMATDYSYYGRHSGLDDE